MHRVQWLSTNKIDIRTGRREMAKQGIYIW